MIGANKETSSDNLDLKLSRTFVSFNLKIHHFYVQNLQELSTNYQEINMSAAVPLERKHIPPLPAYILPLRGLQLLLGIILLGLSAYGISVYSTPGLGLTIFTVRCHSF